MVVNRWLLSNVQAKWQAYWPLLLGCGAGIVLLSSVGGLVILQAYRQVHQLAQVERQYQQEKDQSQRQMVDADWWRHHQSAWQLLIQKGWFEDRREHLLKQVAGLKSNASLGIQSFHLSTAYPVVQQVSPQMGLWASRFTVVATMKQEEEGFALLSALEVLDPLAKLISCEWQRDAQSAPTVDRVLTLNCELEKYFFVAKTGA